MTSSAQSLRSNNDSSIPESPASFHLGKKGIINYIFLQSIFSETTCSEHWLHTNSAQNETLSNVRIQGTELMNYPTREDCNAYSEVPLDCRAQSFLFLWTTESTEYSLTEQSSITTEPNTSFCLPIVINRWPIKYPTLD